MMSDYEDYELKLAFNCDLCKNREECENNVFLPNTIGSVETRIENECFPRDEFKFHMTCKHYQPQDVDNT